MKLERIQVVYTELERYEIELDPDPQSRGPKYLQGVIATCRNYLNAVSQLLLEVHQERQQHARELRAREAAFQMTFDHMLANDERVRRLPNIEDRKSTCRIFLRDEIHVIDSIKAQIGDIEFVEKAIRHRHRELSSTMNEIKLQKSLIQTEISTGAFYGDERVDRGGSVGVGRGGGGGGPLGLDVDVNSEELEQMFEDEVRQAREKSEESPAHEAQPTTPSPPPEPEPELPPEPPSAQAPEPELPPAPLVHGRPTDDDVAAFLGYAAKGQPASMESVEVTGEDFDALLENI